MSSGAGAQTFPTAETARGVTVTTRPRPDFDPAGVRLDGFRLDASAEGGLGYDSNLFGTRRNRVDDAFWTYGLRAGLASDWTRHAVGLALSYDGQRYFDNSILDWDDWSVRTYGRLDIGADSSVEARYNHTRTHLAVSSVDVQEAGIFRPVPYDVDDFQLVGNTRFNRLSLSATGAYQWYRYEDLAAEGGLPPQRLSLNDYSTWYTGLGAGYAVAPGRLITLTGRIQEINYDDSSQRARDSFTWEVLAGFQYDFDGVWQARAAVGYRQRDYDSPALDNLQGPAFEAEVIWAPTQITTVTLAARRTIEESIRANAVSYTRTLAGVRVDHELLRNVILGGELRYERREYEQSDLRATDGVALLSAQWLLNRNLALNASYQYVRRFQGSGGAEEFDQNLVLVSLRASL